MKLDPKVPQHVSREIPLSVNGNAEWIETKHNFALKLITVIVSNRSVSLNVSEV